MNNNPISLKQLFTSKEEAKNKAIEYAFEMLNSQASVPLEMYSGTPLSVSPASLPYQTMQLTHGVNTIASNSISTIQPNTPNNTPITNQSLITSATIPAQANANLHHNPAEYMPLIPQYYYDLNGKHFSFLKLFFLFKLINFLAQYMYSYQPQAPY